MATRFEWDHNKAKRNEQKHRVSFEEARTVFQDPDFIMVLDEAHSHDELRYITIGRSSRGRLLIVAHTDRDDTIRLISARTAARKEREFYAHGY